MMAKIKKLPAKITAAFLRRHDACPAYVKQFQEVFPDGALVTLANTRKAYRENLRLHWLAANLVDTAGECPWCIESDKTKPDIPKAVFNAMKLLLPKKKRVG